MESTKTLIYLLRKDLRVSDNPIFHYLASTPNHGFTHLLPLYIFPAHQMEISGLLKDKNQNPYPEARSAVAGYWRCGPHRAKFLAESIWDLKASLESLESGLALRAGLIGQATRELIQELQEKQHNVDAVWMTSEEGVEECRDERDVDMVCKEQGLEFRLWTDEKFFIDDRDLTIATPQDLPDVFTTYRKSAEPLHDKPRAVLPRPPRASLPAFPSQFMFPAQSSLFTIPNVLEQLVDALVMPVKEYLPHLPPFPQHAVSAHPFIGGEGPANSRLRHLVKSEGMKTYNQTRNGLIGTEFSTKLSAYLAHGCLTARQIHHALLGYENGTDKSVQDVEGFGAGENEGTKSVRFELLWRDYMRLCTKKFKNKLFRLEGFRGDNAEYSEKEKKTKWKSPNEDAAAIDQEPTPGEISDILDRFNRGTTGMGLIDASQRELMHTGYTSNRARQNVASFLSKHMGIDWRYGAEWYEMLLIDYDVSSNWANWQYVSGVGNDPRSEARIFNPVKQAFDYDKEGNYVRAWVPEIAKLEKLENVFQAWTTSAEDLELASLTGNPMVTDPIKRIEFSVEGKPKNLRRSFIRRRGNGQRRNTNPTADESAPGEQKVASPTIPDGPSRPNANYRGREGHRGGYRGGRGGSVGGAGGAFRGNRGHHSGRGGGYRGRYVPSSGRVPWPSAPSGQDGG